MEFTLDYASLAKKLEDQELESGQASPQVYAQLLAIYLLLNDLTSAKFLWKRIPDQIKQENDELSTVWQVGKLMWKRNYSEIYQVIKSRPTWPNHLRNIMNLITDVTRQRAQLLISRAYSTIEISMASNLLGLSREETLNLANQLGWQFDEASEYLSITKTDTKYSASKGNPVLGLDNGTELLEKLTDYILFLEKSTK